MNIYAATQKGKNKSHSEDRIVIDSVILNDECRLFENISPLITGISDGVGGNAGGELAAQFICQHSHILTEDDIQKKSAKINFELLKYASEISGKEKMAATFSAIISGETSKLFHIGNTRVFTVQAGYLKQLTDDHTTYNLLKTRGLYGEAENCNKSEIISCFGGGTNHLFTPDIKDITIPKNIIITSDGIHDYVDIDSMEEIISSEKSCQEKCNLLMQIALNNGSCDDMSIIYQWL